MLLRSALGNRWDFRPRPPCKRDADPPGLKADCDGDHVTNGLAWLRMRQTKPYRHRKPAGSEFRAKPQQPGPACGACQCRNEPVSDIQAPNSEACHFAGAVSWTAYSRPSYWISSTERWPIQLSHGITAAYMFYWSGGSTGDGILLPLLLVCVLL